MEEAKVEKDSGMEDYYKGKSILKREDYNLDPAPARGQGLTLLISEVVS